jgi:hypothetical protein
LSSKRLERGRFIWPSPADGAVTIMPVTRRAAREEYPKSTFSIAPTYRGSHRRSQSAVRVAENMPQPTCDQVALDARLPVAGYPLRRLRRLSISVHELAHKFD